MKVLCVSQTYPLAASSGIALPILIVEVSMLLDHELEILDIIFWHSDSLKLQQKLKLSFNKRILLGGNLLIASPSLNFNLPIWSPASALREFN